MDKGIGRSVIKIKGAVSANNYIDFSNISLEGNFICIQLCMMKSNIATLHIELETTQDIPLRVTISTLYDTPRFLGRSLRLPLPLKPGWTNILFDMNDILRRYCPTGPKGAATNHFKNIRVSSQAAERYYLYLSLYSNDSCMWPVCVCVCVCMFRREYNCVPIWWYEMWSLPVGPSHPTR